MTGTDNHQQVVGIHLAGKHVEPVFHVKQFAVVFRCLMFTLHIIFYVIYRAVGTEEPDAALQLVAQTGYALQPA